MGRGPLHDHWRHACRYEHRLAGDHLAFQPGDYITTADANYGVTPWQHYSKGGSPQETLHAVPATIIGESERTLYGIGFWASGGPPLKGKLHVILDDTTDLKFERITGYEGNPPEPIKETIRLTSGKQFFGVVAPEGFTRFQLLEVEGVLEDQVLMWAADFTFAAITDPADTDKDFDVDTADLTAMFQNFTGAVGAAGGKTMMDGDTDMDGDVDTAT